MGRANFHPRRVLRIEASAPKLSRTRLHDRRGFPLSGNDAIAGQNREPLLSPVDRVSEMLFGLFMALTFVGVVSVAQGGREQIHDMFVAALGCNLAWGLVDAIM